MREADLIESRACRRHVVEGGGPGRQIEQSVLEWLAEASGRLACKLLSISCVVFVWSATARLLTTQSWKVVGLLRSLRGRALRSSIFAMLPDPRRRNALEWDWEQNRVGGATFDEIAFHLSRPASQDSADEQSIALREGMLSIFFGFGAAFAPSARDIGSVAPRSDDREAAHTTQCFWSSVSTLLEFCATPEISRLSLRRP